MKTSMIETASTYTKLDNRLEQQQSKAKIPPKGKLYEPILPIEQWPINQLHNLHKPDFVNHLINYSTGNLLKEIYSDKQLQDEIARVMYLERKRMKEEPWKVDPADENKFWKNVNKQLIRASTQKITELDEDELKYTVKSIVARYGQEIAGNFKIKPYRNASNILPILFSRLLNAMSPKTIAGQAPVFQERVKITGDIPMIRELAKKGTVMVVPTHSSNLDSILVGWGMHALGLPAFIYGAGLNLFNWSWFGYLMGNLGPYRLDRRKKNKFYLQTLKDYALLNLQHGCHSIFFPGGTRSRSGKIEDKLKLGLVGTAFEAQRQSFMSTPAIDVNPNALKNGNKIFVVPLVINYHFVLEASSLIDQHLKRMGQEKYYIKKERFPPLRTVANFVWKSLKARSEAILALGTPMDIFGNNVDVAGNSIAPNGQFVDMKSYYISNGEFKFDAQRNQEYTRMLGEKIQQQYYQKNTVLSSNLVAFAAFELLDRRHRRSDL
ncbi:MAG: 1-acyl-sn-glycerol-3-phosphate acyltransferase, partial [Chitinophagales bacterium]